MPIPEPRLGARYFNPEGTLTPEGVRFFLSLTQNLNEVDVRSAETAAAIGVLSAQVTPLPGQIAALDGRMDALETQADGHDAALVTVNDALALHNARLDALEP